MTTMTEAPARQLTELTAQRDRLRARLDELAAGRDELAPFLASAQQGIDVARRALAELAEAAGGGLVSYGWTGIGPQPEPFWRFAFPNVEPQNVKDAAARRDVVRDEARPLLAARAAIDAELARCHAALGQAEASIASLEADTERERAERVIRWKSATGETRLPDWRERASAVLARLGIA